MIIANTHAGCRRHAAAPEVHPLARSRLQTEKHRRQQLLPARFEHDASARLKAVLADTLSSFERLRNACLCSLDDVYAAVSRAREHVNFLGGHVKLNDSDLNEMKAAAEKTWPCPPNSAKKLLTPNLSQAPQKHQTNIPATPKPKLDIARSFHRLQQQLETNEKLAEELSKLKTHHIAGCCVVHAHRLRDSLLPLTGRRGRQPKVRAEHRSRSAH